MAYNEINDRTSPNSTAGRSGRTITSITIHWWGDPAQNPTAEGVVNWLCNPASQVSAHLVVTGTGRKVWQIVNDADTAWHAGNWEGNLTSIGIECDPRCRDEDYDVIAEVVADLWRYYGKLPIRGHNSWSATRCPGNYDLGRIQREAELKLNPPIVQPPAPEVPNWTPLTNPRKLLTKNSLTYVKDIVTGEQQGDPIPQGKDIKFLSETTYKGVHYYRSEYATGKGFDWGIPFNLLVEVPTPTPDPVPEPTPEPDYDKENNILLKAILAIVTWIKDKLMAVFK